jgi:hypothetical protein
MVLALTFIKFIFENFYLNMDNFDNNWSYQKDWTYKNNYQGKTYLESSRIPSKDLVLHDPSSSREPNIWNRDISQHTPEFLESEEDRMYADMDTYRWYRWAKYPGYTDDNLSNAKFWNSSMEKNVYYVKKLVEKKPFVLEALPIEYLKMTIFVNQIVIREDEKMIYVVHMGSNTESFTDEEFNNLSGHINNIYYKRNLIRINLNDPRDDDESYTNDELDELEKMDKIFQDFLVYMKSHLFTMVKIQVLEW